jgi:hypothetical protein
VDWSPAAFVPGLFPGAASALETEASGQAEGEKGLLAQMTESAAEKLSAWTGWRVNPWIVSAMLISLLALVLLVFLANLGDGGPSNADRWQQVFHDQVDV